MPIWAQIVLGAAAIVTAAGVLWSRVLRPGAKLISTMEKLVPLATELVEQFHAAPQAFATLSLIAKQFEADSGTSLRDVIDRLEIRARANAAAAGVVAENLEVARLLAKKDRERVSQLINLLDKIDIKVDQAAIDSAVVADELDASQARADAQPKEADPGTAADEAARSGLERDEDSP